jgi:ArsR family transcriptional regulator
MGASKSEQFNEKQNRLAGFAKALGHPARVAIIEHLLETGQCICGDIVEELPLAQPTISQHLKELKSAGLIKGNTEGNSVCYCINQKGFEKYEKRMVSLFKKVKKYEETCC